MLAISIDFSLSYFHHNFTKNQQKNVEKTMENQKATFFDVKTLQVRVFFAPGSLLEVSGSDLGTSQELVGGSFGRPWRSPGASGRPPHKLGMAPGAPEMSRDRPGGHFGSILDAPGGSQARFLANFVIDFGCLRRRFRMPFAVHCGRYKAECLR